MKKLLSCFLLPLILTVSGCGYKPFRQGFENQPRSVEPSLTPTVIKKDPHSDLVNLQAPAGPPIPIAVYAFADKTGQRQPNTNVAVLSSAVTQGSEVFLIKALQDAGHGKWFKVIERVGLDDLIKERQLIRNQRETYEGNNAQQLPPLLVAGVMIEGGVVGYDSNVGSGGSGAALLGIGSNVQYRTDEVTVIMRLTSVQTGEVLLTSGASKTILSTSIDSTLLKFVQQGTVSIQLESGQSINEPVTYAVKLAIDAAVEDLVQQGVNKKLWKFSSTSKK
jgi:curli production assembly/transport component CsgG